MLWDFWECATKGSAAPWRAWVSQANIFEVWSTLASKNWNVPQKKHKDLIFVFQQCGLSG
jgi:hypothetical protein